LIDHFYIPKGLYKNSLEHFSRDNSYSCLFKTLYYCILRRLKNETPRPTFEILVFYSIKCYSCKSYKSFSYVTFFFYVKNYCTYLILFFHCHFFIIFMLSSKLLFSCFFTFKCQHYVTFKQCKKIRNVDNVKRKFNKENRKMPHQYQSSSQGKSRLRFQLIN
jgi:hypothetical protein